MKTGDTFLVHQKEPKEKVNFIGAAEGDWPSAEGKARELIMKGSDRILICKVVSVVRRSSEVVTE